MSNKPKGKNDVAWEKLFEKFDILNQVDMHKNFIITADQIKEFREPRLMVKFDHKINLPQIFDKNKLSILPLTRGSYTISHYETYKQFESLGNSITQAKLPDFLESLNSENISSETIAINSAIASGILNDFLNEEELYATVSGRMGSDKFNFNIRNTKTDNLSNINVSNSQIEIDAAYEGENSLALLEAKIDISDDFLIRQLYYPYRLWSTRINKPVRPIFLVYSNGVYNLYEYTFQDKMLYNSLELVQHKNYSIADYEITILDLEDLIKSNDLIEEPEIPFPQANNFNRIINLCELLLNGSLTREDVTNEYAFDIRQTNYYTDAARYLGLIDKIRFNGEITYELTSLGKIIMNSTFKKRQLELCKCILKHFVFKKIFILFLEHGNLPDKHKIVEIMKESNLNDINEDSTYYRRASTISGWLCWMIDLINENYNI